MSSDFMEYTFTRADGSKAFEFVRKATAVREVEQFRRMHGALSALPSYIEAQLEARHRPKLRRQQQSFDLTPLPLFGDGHKQLDLI